MTSNSEVTNILANPQPATSPLGPAVTLPPAPSSNTLLQDLGLVPRTVPSQGTRQTLPPNGDSTFDDDEGAVDDDSAGPTAAPARMLGKGMPSQQPLGREKSHGTSQASDELARVFQDGMRQMQSQQLDFLWQLERYGSFLKELQDDSPEPQDLPGEAPGNKDMGRQSAPSSSASSSAPLLLAGSVLARKVDMKVIELSEAETEHELERLEKGGVHGHHKRDSQGSQGADTRPTWEKKYYRFQQMVFSDVFELVFGGAILFNTVIMALEIQYNGEVVGATMDPPYPMTDEPPRWMKTLVDSSNDALLWTFVVELTAKLLAYRIKFFTGHMVLWNIIDLVVVVFGIIDTYVTMDFGLDPMMIRLIRLIKLGRSVKMFKMSSHIKTMTLIIKSTRASFATLFWAMLLLFMFQTCAGMFVSQMVLSFVEDEFNDLAARQKVFQYYGTFTKIQLTMFEVTHVNYSRAARVLTDNVSERWMWFFLLYRCVIGFAFLQVIRGVFIKAVFGVAERDREMLLHSKRIAAQEFRSKLTDMFWMLFGKTEDDDYSISKAEFLKLMQKSEPKIWMSALGIDTSDPGYLFELMDLDNNGLVSLKEFAASAVKVRGPAQSVDLFIVQTIAERVEAKLDTLLPRNYRGHHHLTTTASETAKLHYGGGVSTVSESGKVQLNDNPNVFKKQKRYTQHQLAEPDHLSPMSPRSSPPDLAGSSNSAMAAAIT